MSTRNPIQELKDALISVGIPLSHGWAHKAKAPYLVWREDGGGDPLKANGKTAEHPIRGTVHLFEPEDLEESKYHKVERALNSIECAWDLSSIQHEQETGLVHFEWSWEVC